MKTFDALHEYNYRLFFIGQLISLPGTFIQFVAQGWLVLQLTGSPLDLGAVTALQFLPMLLAGVWGGVLADRFAKRRLLLLTQSIAALQALLLGVLTVTHTIQPWMVFVLAVLLGCVNALDNPTRQAFVPEVIGPERLTNAVSLSNIVHDGARMVAPAVAGVLVTTVGIAVCFFINAASFGASIASLLLMRSHELHPSKPVPRRRGQLREGFRYAVSTPAIRNPLVMMAIVGTLAFEFPVSLPALARFSFDAAANAYGAMTSAMAAGAVLGGLVMARRGKPTPRELPLAATVFGITILICAVMPTLPLEIAALVLMGAASVVFTVAIHVTLQLEADPQMRGRVMALFSVMVFGSTAIGAPIVGAVAQTTGARAALTVGAAACVAAALWGRRQAGDVTAAEPEETSRAT